MSYFTPSALEWLLHSPASLKEKLKISSLGVGGPDSSRSCPENQRVGTSRQVLRRGLRLSFGLYSTSTPHLLNPTKPSLKASACKDT